MNDTTVTEIQAIAQHFRPAADPSFRPPDCLPFPAGPLLPRQETNCPPLISHGLSHLDRIQLACELWPKDEQKSDIKSRPTDAIKILSAVFGSTLPKKKKALPKRGTLTQLHLLSVRSWFSLHSQPYKDIAFVSEWESWLTDMAIDWEGGGVFFNIKEKIADQRRDRHVGKSRSVEKRGNDMPDLAYMAPRYICACHPKKDVLSKKTTTPNDVPELDLRIDASDKLQRAVEAASKDKWALLQRFWFKQLHSHHTFVWENGGKTKDVHAYHAAALGILHRLRLQPQRESDPLLMRAACGLTQARLRPPTDEKKAIVWYKALSDSSSLSAPFCPGKLGDPKVNLQLALAMKNELKISAKELHAVDTLAREVASLMTDPWVMMELHWRQEDVLRIRQRLFDASKPCERKVFLDRLDRLGEFSDVFDARNAFEKCLHWAGDTWLQRAPSLSKLKELQVTP